MISSILQKLIIFFRIQYISWLKPYQIKVDPKEVKEETYSKLPERLKMQLDAHFNIHENNIENLYKQKKDWAEIVEGKEATLRMPAKNQADETQKKIKKFNEETKLYLIGFDKNLTTSSARKELQRIGFQSASFLEMILFVQMYKESIPQLPIFTLDAYCDADKEIKVLKSDFYCVCYHGDDTLDKSGFRDIGEIECGEFYGYTFQENVLFLAKPIY